MLKPAIEYKEELLHLMQQHSSKTKLVFGTKTPILNFDNSNRYMYVSVDSTNRIIGFFSYKILPINSKETGACDIKIINFTNDLSTFVIDFKNLIISYIFNSQNNTTTMIFHCYLKNPIVSTYRKFARKYGEIISIANSNEEKYKIYKSLLLQQY